MPSPRIMYRFAIGIALAVSTAAGQQAELRPADTVYMPAQADSTSPAFWRDGQFYLINSTGMPLITSGANQFLPSETNQVGLNEQNNIPVWIEAAWQDEDGTLFLWYHHEPDGPCASSNLTAPKIGAAVSEDGGLTMRDLGIVLESGDPEDCSAKNGFFSGGHGDFSVVRDPNDGFFYFFFTNYAGDPARQGVAVARMAFDDRRNPVGAVKKFYQGEWTEPGLGGQVTPVFPAKTPWQRADADSFWGPSLHWNTHLNRFVMLLNRACCETRWPQEGIYISYTADLSQPESWTAPQKILSDIGYGPGYYPQVLGLETGETDTVAGRKARFYVQGVSKWEIVFEP